MVRARTYGHSIDNKGRSGLHWGSCNSHPGLSRSREGREVDGGGRERGERQPGPSTGRGANLFSWIAYSTSDRGGMGWVPPLSVEQGRMGVLSAVRVGGAGGGSGAIARCMYRWGSKWTRQSAVWEGQKAIGRRLGELWVDIWQPNTVVNDTFVGQQPQSPRDAHNNEELAVLNNIRPREARA